MVNLSGTKKKAVVAGHICLDITPVFPRNGKSALSEVMIPGSLITVGNASISTGGAVANTGLCMKLLGADVALMGKVGDDALGGIVLGLLDKHGLSRGMIIDPSGHTSYSVVIALPGTDRIFLHHSGANDSFYAEDIKEDLLEEASLFHFGYPPLMRSLYENEGEELLKIFKKVKQYSCASSLDMCGVDPASDAAKADWEGILKKTLPYVDFFLP
ncbi:MAG: carbohydrate kinase family protein, partial [Treponema sp.]|nr:carbohydrate kinase family protein [Treponema sp.]